MTFSVVQKVTQSFTQLILNILRAWGLMFRFGHIMVRASPVTLVVKNPPASETHRRRGFHPWVRKIPWRRAWQPHQYSCPENPMDRGAWQTTVYRVAKSWTWLKWLSMHACMQSRNVLTLLELIICSASKICT